MIQTEPQRKLKNKMNIKSVIASATVSLLSAAAFAVTGDHLVLDLESGTFTARPATDSVTFNTDEFKTTKIAFRLVTPHAFTLGNNDYNNKQGTATANLTSPYYVALFETTQMQAEKLRLLSGWSGSFDWKTERNYAIAPMIPACNITPFALRGNVSGKVAPTDASLLGKINAKLAAALGGARVDLPSEAEWEFAVRCDTSTGWFFGASNSALNDYAWTDTNSGKDLQNVGTKSPSPWGFYDVYGNAWEMTRNVYAAKVSAADQPDGPDNTSSFRMIRGGACASEVKNINSFRRLSVYGETADAINGFRLVISGDVSALATAGIAGKDASVPAGAEYVMPESVRVTAFSEGETRGVWTLGFTAELQENVDFADWAETSIDHGHIALATYDQLDAEPSLAIVTADNSPAVDAAARTISFTFTSDRATYPERFYRVVITECEE